MAVKASASITLIRVNDGSTGPAGKGIKSITNYYLATSASSGVSVSTSGWTTTVQSITSTNKYLWNYEVVTYTDNSTTRTNPAIIGAYGDKGQNGSTGATGNGIKSVVEYYLVSTKNSGITSSTSGWSTSVPTLTATNKYLWNYEVINYTNGSSTTGEAKVIGVYGDKGQTGATGATGQGIQSITEEYYLSTSKTTQTGGSWSTNAPTWSTGKYLWTRSKIVYKNPTSTAYTTPVCDSSWEAVNDIDVATRNEWLWSAFYGIQPKEVTLQNGGEIVDLPSDNPTGFKKAFHSTSVSSSVHFSWKPTLTANGLGKTYTFSCWVKYSNIKMGTNSWNKLNMFKHNLVYKLSDGTSTSASYVTPGSFVGTSDWKKVSFVQTYKKTNAVSMSANLWIGLEGVASGEFWVTGIQVCEGNKLGSWSPAPEDANTEYDGIYDLITDRETVITQNYNAALEVMKKNIELTVSETYAEKNDVTSLEQTLTSKIDQTAEDVILSFNKANNETRNDLQTFKSEVTSYIKFDTDGMELGKSNSKFKAKLTNEKLAFTEDNTEVAYITNKKLNITDAEIENQLVIGSFAFVPRSNGNMSLKWIE